VQKHQRFYYLRWAGVTYRVPVQVGKYAVLSVHRGVFSYDSSHRVISVLPMLRPPMLIERALILCSGRLPRFNSTSGRLEYFDIPFDVARLAAQLLRQEIV
jgi:hypothetical protein